jgi:hypothetical protein
MTSRSGRQGNDIKEEEEEAILKSHILIICLGITNLALLSHIVP